MVLVYGTSEYYTCPPPCDCKFSIWSFNAYNYLHKSNVSITTQCVACVCMFTAASIMGMIKMGDVAPRVGIEPTSLAFQASVITIPPVRLPDVTTLSTPTSLCGSLFEMSAQTRI